MPADQHDIRSLEAEIRTLRKKAGRQLAEKWRESSEKRLRQAAKSRRSIDSGGQFGRFHGSLEHIADDMTDPEWNEATETWSFKADHPGAVHNEYGARPHEIRARNANVLAFHWPDAPKEIQEKFKHTEEDLVFFQKINHPGVPGIGFMRGGRDDATKWFNAQDTFKLNFGDQQREYTVGDDE